MNSEVDVVVIGAGAAGLAAGKHLQKASKSFLVLEARDRVGGRAWTIPTIYGEYLDLGCQWLHSAAVNPFVQIAQDLGFTVDRARPADWLQRVQNYYGLNKQKSWLAARDLFEDRLKKAAGEREDRTASDLLQGSPWDSLINAVSTWANGVELNYLSVKDYINYIETYEDLSIREGYGNLVAAYGRSLPIVINMPVVGIDYSQKRIAIKTLHGDVKCSSAIITVPTSLIFNGSIRLNPVCPDKIAAAGGLPLGAVKKLFLYYNDKIDNDKVNRHFAGSISKIRTGSYQLYIHGRPIISAYFGGGLASDLEEAGRSATVDYAITELSELFGNDFRKLLIPIAVSEWASDPWAKGSFSHALPGHSEDRSRLASPIEDRIFFAGEACDSQYFSSTHGALLTGRRAADAVISAGSGTPD